MKWNQFNQQLKSSQKTQHRRIDFVMASTPFQSSSVASTSISIVKSSSSSETTEDTISGPIPGLCSPHILLPYLQWNQILKSSQGLYNQGNTCYLNATLQCLLHVPLFSQHILKTSQHNQEMQSNLKTIFDMYQKFVIEYWNNLSKRSLSPRLLYQNIRRIGKHLRPGRQEDAHEFLRLLLDCIHEEILKANGIKSSPQNLKLQSTTLICRVFGGYLRNELRCSVCNYKSQTYNLFQDLQLDLNFPSIQASFSHFIKPEVLDRGNEWLCEKCNKKVKVDSYERKQFRGILIYLGNETNDCESRTHGFSVAIKAIFLRRIRCQDNETHRFLSDFH